MGLMDSQRYGGGRHSDIRGRIGKGWLSQDLLPKDDRDRFSQYVVEKITNKLREVFPEVSLLK